MNEEHRTQSIYSFSRIIPTRKASTMTTDARHHYVIIVIMICPHLMLLNEEHLAFATAIKVVKRTENKQIYCFSLSGLLRRCLMNQSRFLLTLCILFSLLFLSSSALWFCVVFTSGILIKETRSNKTRLDRARLSSQK